MRKTFSPVFILNLERIYLNLHLYREQIFIRCKQKKLYLCGDFNIDLLKYENHELTRTFVDTLLSLGLFPLITKPTRNTDIGETLMDNIFTNLYLTLNIKVDY